jgi:AraC-like DNA-binding protein
MATIEMHVTDRRAGSASARITDACIEYATRVRFQHVTIADLCAVAGVSERRLRDAFYDVHGTSPTAQLRKLALIEVRRALFEAPSARDAVTRVAMDFGFEHLSRFAGHYRAAFGESPSATLRRSVSA